MHMNDISIPEYARILGDVIKKARENAVLTQAECFLFCLYFFVHH